MNKHAAMKIIFSSLGTILLLFVAVPVLRMLFSASPATLVSTAGEAGVLGSIALTFRASLWSTVAALFLGIPFAYILARHNFPGKQIVEGIIDIPVIIPHTAAGIALLMVLGRNSLFARITGISLMGTEAAISCGMFFVSMPLLVNTVKDGFNLIDNRYEKTAMTLGASRWQAFWTVSLPLVKKSIISGSILMWARGISEFGAVVILAYHPMTAPVLIFERFQSFGLAYAAPVTVILIILSLCIFIVLRLFGRKTRRKKYD
ncbi:MAG: ABC transporter permease [Spirochaetales bacterium]|nr:ABC transporter permease [Spirochaetales bacterium]